MQLKKIVIRVIDDAIDKSAWVHVAYADKELYEQFLSEMDCTPTEFAEYMTRWAKEDFNYSTTMTHSNEIEVLRQLVLKYYKTAFPYVFIDSTTDRQGWVRTWLTKKMEEELKKYGKARKI
jgi:hypothetical protein